MSNVSCIAWRIPCARSGVWGLSSSKRALLRSANRDLRIPSLLRSFSDSRHLSLPSILGPARLAVNRPVQYSSSAPSRSFRTSRSLSAKKTRPPPEHGVHPRSEAFSAAEISEIFGGQTYTPALGNRILAILQGRRITGTLDLDLPNDITRSTSSQDLDLALQWLRANYPLDEDAAIFARIEREEQEEQDKLRRRAEQLGLYKPQSGSYDAERGEQGEASGKSILKQMRKFNEEKNRAEEEKNRVEEEKSAREWMEGEARDARKFKDNIQNNTALQQFREHAVEEGKFYVYLMELELAYSRCSATSCGSQRTSASGMDTEASSARHE